MKRWYGSSIVILLLLSMSYGIVSAETGWKFHSDLQNSGVYDDGGVRPTPELLWKFKTDREIMSSPTVSNGVVFFGCVDSILYALDASTGVKKMDVQDRGCGGILQSRSFQWCSVFWKLGLYLVCP
ncbi:hypothetical protein DLD82_16180 [Methanospirillum stamsii]|uniref:Uncharacterized protein n=1 Tax=Methanospirillum stamsii TaxID=1277351 RepID=A0A2V2MSF3_9EURY|nr:hypothetical protein DLD82_16180 [Methanospirillum stamsii]